MPPGHIKALGAYNPQQPLALSGSGAESGGRGGDGTPKDELHGKRAALWGGREFGIGVFGIGIHGEKETG